MTEKTFIDYCQGIEDSRIPGLIKYPLNEILFCCVCAIICRCSDWEEINLWANHHVKWLKKFLPYANGIACPTTLARVFNSIDSAKFKTIFTEWISNLSLDLSKKQVVLDGKTIKGSKLSSDGSGAAHIVSAYVHEYGLVIGQEKVSEKSNEITAIPELLTNLAIEGSIVSIDAIGTQKEIVKEIVNKKADYVLAVKANQKSLYDDISLYYENLDKDIVYDEYEDTDASHGRIEVRNCKVVKDIEWLRKRHVEWKEISSIAVVDSIRINKKTLKETRQKRYYISSLKDNARSMLSYVRNHWSIENKLHWVLDMNFKEDSCRTRKNHGAENLNIIRKCALNHIRRFQDKGKKKSIKLKMLTAAYDLNYLKNLLLL